MPWNNVTGERRRLYGGRHELCSSSENVCKIARFNLQSYILVSFQHITFKLGNFTYFEAFFLAVLRDFRQLVPVWDQFAKIWRSNVEKTVEGSIRNWPILSLQSSNRAVMLVDKTKQKKYAFVFGGRKTLSFLSTKMVPWRQLTYMICSPKFDQTHKFKLF